jgi:hypothetical protein
MWTLNYDDYVKVLRIRQGLYDVLENGNTVSDNIAGVATCIIQSCEILVMKFSMLHRF